MVLLPLASNLNFCGVIHAFEPFLSSYQDLSSMIYQAGLMSRIKLHNIVVSDHEGSASMHLPTYFQSGAAVMRETEKTKEGEL